jgi:hypothetical protein
MEPKVHYRAHKSPPLVPTVSQMCRVYTFPPYFHKIHSSHLRLGLPSGHPHSDFPTKILRTFFISVVCDMPHRLHLIKFKIMYFFIALLHVSLFSLWKTAVLLEVS